GGARRRPSAAPRRHVPPGQGPRGRLWRYRPCLRCQAPGPRRGRHAVRICVVGCGAVGSLFAAHLAQLDDVEVWAYELAREHVAAINERGLRLSGAADLVGRIRATSDAAELPPCDYGIVATKSMHTASAIAATTPAFA